MLWVQIFTHLLSEKFFRRYILLLRKIAVFVEKLIETIKNLREKPIFEKKLKIGWLKQHRNKKQIKQNILQLNYYQFRYLSKRRKNIVIRTY